ncbi:MAG: hypothetical protein JWP25_7914 [Bradyrhizobium sp.]|nr:hypothetical protein [Bradyrhizobium sp.]MEA2865547.1 hypothetical protein [Bradyrhizobium sp.]
MQRIWMTVTIAFVAAPALAQQPTDAQRSAIRSACRSDYMAHCSSVPPGGMASLQCLQKNMSSLSSSCQRAVNAIEAPAAEKSQAPAAEKSEPPATPPKAEAPAAAESAKSSETPAAPAAKVAASPLVKKPSSAQVAAIRSACRSDYQRSCAGVPTGGAAALSCLEKNKSKLSQGCQQAVNAVGGTSAPAADAPAGAPAAGQAAAPAAPAPAMVLRPMRPREELFVARSCGGDIQALCGGVPAGGGRLMRCLASQPASLSPTCSDVLTQFSVSQ